MKKILFTTTALHQPWNGGDWDMTDGNTSAINKCLDEHEDYDALQEIYADLEQAEARIEELEADLHLMKTAGIVEIAIRNPNVSEYMAHWERRAEGAEAKLAKARENALREAVDHISHHGSRNDIYSKSRNDAASAILTILAELKGQE